MNKLFATVALTASVVACTPAPDATVELLVDSSDAAVVAETRRILLERFGEYHARIESKVEGSVVTVTFKHGAPDPAVVRYLYSTPGKLRTSLSGPSIPGEAVLFTDRDLEDVRAGVDESGSAVLNIRLTPAGGKRMLRLTGRHVGAAAHTVLDGRTLFDARIQSVLSDSFRITLQDQDRERAHALAVILQAGALPACVSERAR
jgi:preprotein translocase subunit SecD